MNTPEAEASAPFIKKFQDGKNCYIFDVNTNQIIEVEQPIYDIIDAFCDGDAGPARFNGDYTQQEIEDYMEQIKQARHNDGLFSGFRPSEITFGIQEAQDVENLHRENGLNQLILELTKECNLHCGYCSTSGKYSTKIVDTSHTLSGDGWKRAVDFFCRQATGIRQPCITFYGGEPLIHFELIREIVSHVRDFYSERNIIFSYDHQRHSPG